MTVGLVLPRMYRVMYNDVLPSGNFRLFVCASSVAVQKQRRPAWNRLLARHKSLYCDDRSGVMAWAEHLGKQPLDFLIGPPASDPNDWLKEWDGVFNELNYIVEYPFVVPCRSVEAVQQLAGRFDVAVDMMAMRWGELSPWHLTGKNVWVLGDSPDTLWQHFCELYTVGAFVRGVLVVGWHTWVSRRLAWPRRPHGQYISCVNIAEAFTKSIQNIRWYWEAIGTAQGL